MCGIAGVVRLEPGAPPPAQVEALAMAERIRHRGPDRRTAWVSPSGACALGHARLKVIDLETGDQPMASEDGSVQVVFNGEIYGFRELRRELEAAGHRFRTRSDTEVLVHGYREWGDILPERLDGMFAFAVWDEARGRMLLARDRVGKKPLYWTVQAGRFAFASEIKALLALPWISSGMDPEALPYYLAYGYVPAPRTFYRGVWKLPPATALVVTASGRDGAGVEADDGGGRAGRRYWSVRWSSGRMRAEEARPRLRTLLGDAVERRLVADVPLGAFLSGGIDSTVIVGLMRARGVERPRTFSIGFADDPKYDETRWARLAAERFGTEHTEFVVEADALDLIDELVEAYDEPFGDSSAIPTHVVSRLAREHVTVALTGDGGDELFAGYPRFLGMVLAERTPRALARAGELGARVLPHHPSFRHPVRRAERFLRAAALPAEERLLRWIGFLPEVERFLRPEARGGVDRRALLESFRRPWDAHAGESPLARALATNFQTYLAEDLMVKADRCSMAHGLELRSPLLDTAVIEFAASLPDHLRIRRGRLKWLLKTAFADLLPPEIRRRGKWGFGIPLPTWFRTRWKARFEAEVLGQHARIGAWLRLDPVRALWVEHQEGRADHGHALWALLTLETWLRARE